MRRKTSRRLIRIISAVPGLYWLLAFLCARRVRIDGRSMHPALLPGERVLFDRLAYRVERPRKGDIALVQHPGRDIRIVKRITALPGDVVGSRTLAGDEFWVEGDYTEGSTDSRD